LIPQFGKPSFRSPNTNTAIVVPGQSTGPFGIVAGVSAGCRCPTAVVEGGSALVHWAEARPEPSARRDHRASRNQRRPANTRTCAVGGGLCQTRRGQDGAHRRAAAHRGWEQAEPSLYRLARIAFPRNGADAEAVPLESGKGQRAQWHKSNSKIEPVWYRNNSTPHRRKGGGVAGL